MILDKYFRRDIVDERELNDVLLNQEELMKHAQDLAQNHYLIKDTKLNYMLIPRMNKSYNYIKSVYRSINTGEDTQSISQDAEWLLDNFYIIEEQVKEIRRSLSKGYYSGLPGLKNSILKGYPRVYAIALELVSHTDGRIDEDTVLNFINAYQSKSLLSSGELWALGLMIRIALIENIKRSSEKIIVTQKQWHKADEVANILLSNKNISFEDVKKLIHEKVITVERIPTSFFERLLQRIRMNSDDTTILIQYIDRILQEYDTNITNIVEIDHQILAARQVSIGNAITSLKYVSTLDWAQIFERLSNVEQILRQDPDGTYPAMDFESRDYYRHEVEKIAKRYNTSETFVARKAIECAKEVLNDNNKPGYINHVGFYIIGKGKSILESKLDHNKSNIRIRRLIKKYPAAFYISSIIALTVIFICAIALLSMKVGISASNLVIMVAVSLIPVSEIAVQAVNWTLMHINKPTIIPKIELKNGIPDDSATMVIIPTLLTSVKRVKELLSQLEVIYIANKEKNLYFALVGDFKDTKEEKLPDDDKIVESALNGIKKLNKKYSPEKDVFFYFHRKRIFCKMQESFMGWERKRGAIVEFNELLNGSNDTSYNIKSTEEIDKLPHIKYVITLDADTNLTMDTAKKLVGTMMHPLNKAVIDRERNIVVEGYGLLQPRIGVDIVSANTTRFSKIFAGQGGIDPYTTAVSDVYQDLFGEGIFTGKGIYDVDVFRNILRDLIPDNAVLSHDLLEGSFVRAGLVTDILLIDGFPAKYNSYMMRLHRWVRGDWQLIPWLFKRIRNREGKLIENPLSTISKWKIIDNLRRSLVAPFTILLLFLGVLSPINGLLSLGLSMLVMFMPFLASVLDTCIGKVRVNTGSRDNVITTGIKNSFYSSLLQFAFLPYQGYMMTDAIIRTLYRVFVSKRNLLEWVTAADMERRLKNDLLSFLSKMWISITIALAFIIASGYFKPNMFYYVFAISVLWIMSPYVAYIVSYPKVDHDVELSESNIKELRKIARRTWRYFEDFVTEKENYLPPDNFQLDPYAGIAERTSPTNIGLYLSSTIAARDFGFIGTVEMIDRIENTIRTIEKMEKWHGHLYNWYKTDTLEPLRPLYVSTVDSGNLVGYLIVLKEGLKEIIEKPLIEGLYEGLVDLIDILNEDIPDLKIKDYYLKDDFNIYDWNHYLDMLEDKIERIKTDDENGWYQKTKDTIALYKKEIDELIPWTKNIDNHGIYKNLLDDLSLEGLNLAYKKLIDSDENYDNNKIMTAFNKTNEILERIHHLIDRLQNLIDATEFRPLFDSRRQLFSIGYNIEDEKLTKSYYDLFASEARQASFIAIAKKEVDMKHWFRMGRMVTAESNLKGLVSWSGTMFEYFMPLLIMRNYKNTLIDETYKFVVTMQKKYAKKYNIPWGISESGFYSFDIRLNYQYKAFGVPGLGLKRGLSHDLVIAPYGTILALPVDPQSVVTNIEKLNKLGMLGKYGLYEAIDFTPERIPYGKKYAIVKSFMSHHLGMSLLALNNFINGNIMQRRFHSDPHIKAAEILLQERIPDGTMVMREEIEAQRKFEELSKEDVKTVRVIEEFEKPLPEVHIISNGDYSVVLTDRGTGYSKKEGISVTRWRNKLGELDGTFIFIQNINSNTTWSATHAPFLEKNEKYKVVFTQDMAKFYKRVGNIDTETEIIVSPEDNAEIRRVTLKNHSQHSRTLEITSYLEPVLSDINADIAHPAFNKLFIKTENLYSSDTIIAKRRPRDLSKPSVWASHAVTVEGGETVGDTQFETDRVKFIGRGRTLKNPIALEPDRPLSNSDGSVLDPIMSLRKRIRLSPGQTAMVIFITAIGDSKNEVLKLAEKYKDVGATERAFEMSLSRGKVELDYLNLKSDELNLFQRMLPHIIFLSPIRMKKEEYILKNEKGQSGLWAYGISGDIPIVLMEIGKKEELPILKQLLKAHEYWRMKGILVDLVVLNSDKGGYIDALNDKIKDVINGSFAYNIVGSYGGIFLLQKSSMPQEDIVLLNTVARLSLKGDMPISEQIKLDIANDDERYIEWPEKVDVNYPVLQTHVYLEYDNGCGGFSDDGHSYIICLEDKKETPVPWINVISNYKFGFQVSESGSGFTWSENSREYKLTPWSNDPVLDESGEILYLRDDFTGKYWTITPKPIREDEPYIVEHGFGHTVFRHVSSEIKQDMLEFVPMNDTVKITMVKLKNLSHKNRKLSLYYYVKPVLGVFDSMTSPYIVTEMDKGLGALLIRNMYNEDFPNRISFISTSGNIRSYTGNLSEFLGSDFDIKRPESLKKESLSNNAGAGYNPCAAIQIDVELREDEEKEIIFMLGTGTSNEDVNRIIKYYKDLNNSKEALKYVDTFWGNFVSTIKVSTPDKSMDLLLNGWLLYQTISCRIWARSAFYQSGGAYGFRDQLQDTMNVVYIAPELTRAQILNACAHQYKEGDVMHWWHPGTDRGIRTRYSDDLLWLPYAVADYVNVTGDNKVLDVEMPFIEDEPLKDGEDERYNKPRIAEETGTVYEHCIRAIEHSLRFGKHGIPLMGSGDWNDGMNMVGNKGKGESIWLGWFMYVTLKKFIPLCFKNNDNEKAEKYKNIAMDIINSIEENGWDGSWYRRAYFDDGVPLGSSINSECKIDSIAQSWAAISGAAKKERVKEALDALENYLIDYDNALIKLLSPPFDKGDLNPGYIKGYVPGVRENGGQYTHAAIWAIMAYAVIGDGDMACKLYSMINPINHTRTPIECAKYKVEPYVMAADVYAVEPNVGRGGWTWYTGSSGWMYRVGIEHILGFKKIGDTLIIDPCINKSWKNYKIEYMYKDKTKYIIKVNNPEGINKGVQEVYVDEKLIDDKKVKLIDDNKVHSVVVNLGTKVAAKI
ncbi:glucoamylase family protein [Thermoanaerobacterium sp. RBIITD]|uniref:GH36-type glycosyl hydrolase domain-containing protein n=1 Tax=Thermoanaerobacterium sp. RBIITD TaxID=1550240 RepID=UPI0015601607